MQQSIVGFHKDKLDDWVADLACGHTQHVRHNPPWHNRPWVVAAEMRLEMLGSLLDCKICDGDSAVGEIGVNSPSATKQ